MLITIVNVFSVLLSVCLIVVYFVYIIYKLLHGMDPEDAKFLRTDRRPGTLDVHSNINALVLNYELEVSVIGDRDEYVYGEKKSMKKVIELPLLNSRTDSTALAKEILSQCDLIHPSRLVEVEQLIYYLKKRKLVHNNSKDGDYMDRSTPNEDGYNINSLNEYIELLYEGLPDKIKASQAILTLAKDAENLEALSRNETVLSALARVLREDWKRSIVLSTNLIFTFFCFSMYSAFHHVILHYKIGSLCMDIIDFELRRYYEWKADLDGVKTPSLEPPIIRKLCSTSASMTDIQRSRIPEPVRPKSGNFNDLNMKNIMEGSIYDDLSNSTDSLDEKKETEADKRKKYRTLMKKQDQLLRVSFYLLLNIAEDENVEEKMTKRNIVGLLVKALDRENEELLMLVVTFLKKLSIMQANKDDMADLCIVEKCAKLLQTSGSVDLTHLTMKLLFNLSFDECLRVKMVKSGLLPKFVSLLMDDRHQEMVIKLLYHFSYDNDVIAQFAYTECVSLITDMLILTAANKVDPVLVALCVNLAKHPSNAQQMADNSRLHSLMARAFQYQDAILMKMIHNISEHDCTRSSFIEFVGDLAKAVTESKRDDFVLECLGVLSNLHMPDLDWAEIFKHFDMMARLKQIVQSNNTEADLVLQVVVFLGTACFDEECALLFCKSATAEMLIELLKTYQEDDEIVLQILYVFLVLMSHLSSAEYIINNTDVAAYVIDLIGDTSKPIQKICGMTLNAIADSSPEWGDRIRIERFRHHNSQWLQMVDSHELEAEEEEDDELPPYLNTEYLSTAVLHPLSEAADDLNRAEDEGNSKVKQVDFVGDIVENGLLQDNEMESLESL